MKSLDNHVKRSNLLNEFLWWCAGVNKEILRQCPTDYAKYSGMGGTILFTALMAMLSGGYAMFFVFSSTKIAIAFGIFWGMLIFNLDRFIVNTMYSDGKVTISWKELYSGLPRIIMAVFLGIVISTPLELKIYEKSINTELKSMKQEKLKELLTDDETKLEDLREMRDRTISRPMDDGVTGRIDQTVAEEKAELKTLVSERNKLQSDINNLNAQRRRLSPVTDSARYASLGNQIYSIKKRRDALDVQISRKQSIITSGISKAQGHIEENVAQRKRDIDKIDSTIANLEKKIHDAENEYGSQLADEFDGFQGRMMAFSSLKQNRSTWWAALFISLLFIIIETAPTFFKMMIASGPYDDMLRSEMHRVRVLSDKAISDINDKVNTLVQISVEKNKAQLEAELAANKEVMEKVAAVQAELLQTAISKWREEELAKIEQDASGYLTTSNNA